MNRRNFNVLAAALAAFTAIPATAQSTWPNKPITLVVPFAPGGTSARTNTQWLPPSCR